MEPLPDRIESSRLVIRRWTTGDAAALGVAVRESYDHLLPWMPWAPSTAAMTDPELVDLVAGWEVAWRQGGDVGFGVFRDGVVVGSSGLHRRIGPGALEIGYWIHVDHVGRGYATEVSAALTHTAFTIDGIDRVEIHHDTANMISARVPARLGYTYIGATPREVQAPGEIGEQRAWRVTRGEWVGRADAPAVS